MIDSIQHPHVHETLASARARKSSITPSPADWRDHWIYFLLLDRFNNPSAAPRRSPWDGAHNTFQGGTFKGVQAQLGYLKGLGAGALWLSPVFKNCQYEAETYHGYGIQNFIAIEPRFASDPAAAQRDPAFAERELRELIDAIHAHGMYVILDIVLNHAGNVFSYHTHAGDVAQTAWHDGGTLPIRWHDADGSARADWPEAPANPPADAAVWPAELRHNAFFRRQGNAFTRPGNLSEEAGDFYSLKEFATDYARSDPLYGTSHPVRDALIRAYQYIIAKFDVDGFRIDTLKFIEPEFSRTFGNAMREFALCIGKKNFFTFGEIYDDEGKVEQFVGRDSSIAGDIIGVDAALDFPLFFRLPGMVKGMRSPSDVISLYLRRQQLQSTQISSHGDAGQYFVTFLDNHDQPARFRYVDPNDPHRYDAQMSMGLGLLFTLQGIPCLYYGTEQGLHGAGAGPESVREALWGKPDAFDARHPIYHAVQLLAGAREHHPALRYGRQYFRPTAENGIDFGYCSAQSGVLAFSRLLFDREVLVLANTDTQLAFTGEVIIDAALNSPGAPFVCVFCNTGSTPAPVSALEKALHTVRITDTNGHVTNGPARTLPVQLAPMTFQIWAKAS